LVLLIHLIKQILILSHDLPVLVLAVTPQTQDV
jgi:hypothetical protein